MRQKDGFKLRKVMGQSIIVGEGLDHVDFNKIISLNASAELLWNAVEGRDFTEADLAAVLIDNYGIDEETANRDAAEIAARWLENGLISK